MTDQERAIALVLAERQRQDEKWGVQSHSPIEWMSILTEEVGEAAEGANEAHWNDATIESYKTEMVQVAAVALNAIENLERFGL